MNVQNTSPKQNAVSQLPKNTKKHDVIYSRFIGEKKLLLIVVAYEQDNEDCFAWFIETQNGCMIRLYLPCVSTGLVAYIDNKEVKFDIEIPKELKHTI